LGIIGVVVDIGMVVEVPRSAVDLVEGAPNVPIFTIVVVESADVESVDDPREAGALANRAVDANPAGNVSFRRRVECGGVTVAQPQGEVCYHRLLLLQPSREIPVERDERVGLVGQVAGECAWGGPLGR
jgi:hypothetical protein